MATKFDPRAAARGLAKAVMEAQPDEPIIKLSVSRIEPDPNQPRKIFDPKTIEALAESIRTVGQEQPIGVRPIQGNPNADYRIIWGERRWRACQLAGIPMVRGVIRHLTDADEKEIYAAQVAENFGQQSMTLPEKVAAVLRMTELWGAAEAIERMSLPKSDVSKLTTIGRAAGATKAALDGGLTESIETLYLLARVQKKDQATAERLVSSWSNPDKRLGARAQVQHALERLNADDNDESGGGSRRPTAPRTRRSLDGEQVADRFGHGRSADEALSVRSVERDGAHVLLHTETAGTLRVNTDSLLAPLAAAGLVRLVKG